MQFTMSTLVLDNKCYPPEMRLYNDKEQLIIKKEVNDIYEEISKVKFGKNEFEKIRMLRMIDKVRQLFEPRTIKIKENNE